MSGRGGGGGGPAARALGRGSFGTAAATNGRRGMRSSSPSRWILFAVAMAMAIAMGVLSVVSNGHARGSFESVAKAEAEANANAEENDHRRRLLQSGEKEDGAFRVLYVVTSSGRNYKKSTSSKKWDRWNNLVVPILKQSLESYYKNDDNDNDNDTGNDGDKKRNYQVDLYMITSYHVSQEDKDVLRQALPPSTGIQYWSNAMPLMYHCDEFFDEPASTMFAKCIDASEPDYKPISYMKNTNDTEDHRNLRVRLREGSAQLARQHRLVVKDKLPHYDFFVVMEDDMLYAKSHVETHRAVSARVRLLRDAALEREGAGRDGESGNPYPGDSWKAPLPYRFLNRMTAGFVRVEVLGASYRDTCKAKGKHNPDWTPPSVSVPEPFSENAIDPKTCCRVDANANSNSNSNSTPGSNATLSSSPSPSSVAEPAWQAFTENTDPSNEDLVLWETKLPGFFLRRWDPIGANASETGGGSWFASPIKGHTNFPGYWAGYQITNRYDEDLRKNGNYEAPWELQFRQGKLAAQTGGWMASSGEILHYHRTLCPEQQTSFLPPFELPRHKRDGLFRHNVEYWSGGLQIYSNKGCGLQRVYEMESAKDFSRHLVYHASNNKQCFFKYLQEPPAVPASIGPRIDRVREIRKRAKEDGDASTKESKDGDSDSDSLLDEYLNIDARMVRVQTLWNHLSEVRDGILRDCSEDDHTA